MKTKVTETGAHAEVTIPVLLAEGASATVQSTSAPPATSTEERPPALDSHPESSSGGGLGGQRIASVVVAGAGVVAIGVGAYLNLAGKSDYNSAVAGCHNGLCTPSEASSASSAASRGTVGMVVMGVGLAAIAGGAVLWFTAPSARSAAPAVGVGPGALFLRGRF